MKKGLHSIGEFSINTQCNDEKGCKMSGEIKRKERIIELDYIRAFAILCVLLTHTTERVYTLNAMTLAQESMHSRIFSVSLFTVGRLGVPLFSS